MLRPPPPRRNNVNTTLRLGTLSSVIGLATLAGCAHFQGSAPLGAPHRITLSGSNEVPPVTTPASGSGTVTVNADCTVQANITVTGMTATMAHIHEGAAGKNGPVIVPLNKTADNVFQAPAGAKLTESQCAAHRAGTTYVNVHSAKHPGGEVRAQLGNR
jgi:hypothetical protein